MSIFSKKQFSNHKSSATFSLTIPKNQQSTPLTTDENDERFLSSYQNYKEKKLVSSLQDKSLKTLQIKEITNFIPENFRKRAKTAASQLKLSIETAEYTDDYYLGGKQKYQISNTPGYKAFTQKYVKTCFDKEGNLLYPDKQQTQNQISRDRLKSEEMYRMKIMNAKQDEKNFLSNIEKKIKNNNNEAFIVTIMRDLAKVELGKSTFTAEQSEKNSQLYVDENKTKFLESIKSRSINCLQEVVKNGKSIQGYISAQGEIEKNYQNMKKVLEETLKDQ